jgi:hypothetical protein
MAFRPDLGTMQRGAFILPLSGFPDVELLAIDRASDEQRERFSTLCVTNHAANNW